MSNSAIWMARKRERARAAGLCLTCCKEKPLGGRSICANCNSARHNRLRRSRQHNRESAGLQQIIEAHEKEGDRARNHHLYANAAQHYQNALSIPTIAPADRARISKKLVTTLFFGDHPDVANRWFDRFSGLHLSGFSNATEFAELLLQRARQLWIDAKAEESLDMTIQVIRIAEVSSNATLWKKANVSMANAFVVLSRFREAEQYLRAAGIVSDQEDSSLCALYHLEYGIIAAAFGKAAQAYEHFERAAHVAKENLDPYNVTVVLSDYAQWAMALGDTERAKANYEQALLVVRRNHMGWLIPQLCLEYANILARMGRQGNAHDYLLEALSYDAQVAILDEWFAAVGIPIALELHDESTLTRCARSAAIELAFQSLECVRIGPVVSAFAQLYVRQGRIRKVRALLHRALEVITNVDECIDFPLEVARHGARSDIPRARALVEARAALPSAHVAEACLVFFDAIVHQRFRRTEETQRRAAEAAVRFDELQWYAYADRARLLIPSESRGARLHAIAEKPFAGVTTFTTRERQVVELALKGHTNRQIAAYLMIREHTVEKHMGTIMNRLGIRSRHQLADVLTKPHAS